LLENEEILLWDSFTGTPCRTMNVGLLFRDMNVVLLDELSLCVSFVTMHCIVRASTTSQLKF